MKTYALTNKNGFIEIMRVMHGDIQNELQKSLPVGEEFSLDKLGYDSYVEIKESEIPDDRTFRKAWVVDGKKKIKTDMNKAREIHMDKIRELRNKKLSDLDIETLKGNDVQAEKQVLRDLPDTVDLSSFKTPEELKEYIPEELK